MSDEEQRPQAHDGWIHFRVTRDRDGRMTLVEALVDGEHVGKVPVTNFELRERPRDGDGVATLEVSGYRVEVVTASADPVTA